MMRKRTPAARNAQWNAGRRSGNRRISVRRCREVEWEKREPLVQRCREAARMKWRISVRRCREAEWEASVQRYRAAEWEKRETLVLQCRAAEWKTTVPQCRAARRKTVRHPQWKIMTASQRRSIWEESLGSHRRWAGWCAWRDPRGNGLPGDRFPYPGRL